MTYARARLWLGISGVGVFVLLSGAALYGDWARRFLGGYSEPAGLAIFIGVYMAVSAPLDFLGGYWLPRGYGRSGESFGAFVGGWLRGVVAQGAVLLGCGMVVLGAAGMLGTAGALLAAGMLMVLLLIFQGALARLVGGLRAGRREAAFDVYEAADMGFVGGVVGLPGMERVIVPAAWAGISGQLVELQRKRRAGVIQGGARVRGLGVAVGWNLLGLWIATMLPGANPATATGLVNTALWFTIWSFLGLLLLPSVSRGGVFEADRFALEQGVRETELVRAMSTLDGLQDDEPARAKWIERVFHPVPSVESRKAALRAKKKQTGAWQAARMALYLSWVCLGLLGRAVHCNSGRPQLWVMFPGD